MLLRVAVAIGLLFLPTSLLAQSEKRIALLIGNKDYKPGVGSLTNPLNDIRTISDALKAVGFEVLKPVENAQRAAMLLAVHAFAIRLKAAGSDAVGFLYYSGHGIASEGENYLIPTDIDEPSTVLLRVQGVKQSEVLAILRTEAPNAAHYLVLDACRNTLQGARGGKGFVAVGQQSGVLVAFATEPGKTASDLGQGSGPYASALAAELIKPGQNDLLMFHNVRVAVIERTSGDQVPWTEDGIQRRQRVLFGGQSSTAASPLPARGSAGQLSEAAEAWSAAKDATSIAVLERFVARYKDTFYADLARARIEELTKKQVAVASPPSSPSPRPQQPPTAKDASQSAWVKLCSDSPDKRAAKTCLTHHERLDGNTGRVLVSATVRQVQGQDAKSLKVVLPSGMKQSADIGVGIYAEDHWEKLTNKTSTDTSNGYLFKMKFSSCGTGGCTSEIPANPDMVERMRNGGGMLVFAIDADGSHQAFPVPLAGFDSAFTGEPTDNQKYLQARKQLLEQIHDRQRQR